jgi:lysozyme
MMPRTMQLNLKRLITLHEERRKFPYIDTLGNITFGIGYNATARGMPDSWIDKQYDQDVSFFYFNLNHDFPWFKDLCEARQMALIDMCFMGYKRFLEFEKMLAALAASDYETAASEIVNSVWAQEVKTRAVDIEKIILTGDLAWTS